MKLHCNQILLTGQYSSTYQAQGHNFLLHSRRSLAESLQYYRLGAPYHYTYTFER
ncbi:hypothetical protein D3C84_498090 [compost metagenome]